MNENNNLLYSKLNVNVKTNMNDELVVKIHEKIVSENKLRQKVKQNYLISSTHR